MKDYNTKVSGVCADSIAFSLDDEGRVHNVAFDDGCDGNQKAIAKLVEGMPAEKVVALLRGNTCGRKQTSCADQFARALADAAGIAE